ncbi:hypothetical protein LTR96_004042 [Exophiala xenobiotica]|nr:hypothetical protein LTR96_004042 [Exophiala xenobiotica]KAK5339654.1 hypothetical protein LTR98_004456 [Exophiala xenobiotica]
MSSPLSRLKGMLCIPEDPESRTEKATIKSKKQATAVLKHDENEQRGSSDSSSSASTTEETKWSNQVLNVLKAFNIKNLETIKDVALVGVEGEPIDDKTYLMERIIQLAADLPVTSRTSATLTNTFLNQLWTDLQHPPQSYLGNDFVFRNADGSGNNILWPHLGAAGQPYARTVRPRSLRPVARPDPGVIFDSILARKKFEPHPNKISSVLFYVASIIIHDIFHTSHDDYNISEVDSYLDLAPLYGSSDAQQQSVRTMRDGKLKPDCFFDIRILGFPPGVGVLLIMFNRFHNHVAENLALIDEGGRFSRVLNPRGPRKEGADPEKDYDEALFQTARLITTGLYINIVLRDYVRTILNLNRVDSAWNLDPRSEEGKAIFGHKILEATGNSVSAEFNLVYRWHSCVSQRDEEWTKQIYHKIFGNQDSTNMGVFLSALNGWAQTLSKDPMERPFADLKRLPDGKYPDSDLAAIWTASVSDVAGRYGAAHVPDVLKNVEILGIIQSRSWNLASLNEFREYFKLKPYEKFEEINPDPLIAEQLRHLYGHPDNVEIYPGVIIEAAKEPKKPGSGLCTNFTTSRAILSDAVALVRGDRFYTVDYTPANLTNWGFHAADSDAQVNYGCVLYKLVLTALPNSYRQDSIYAHYPLVIPEENRVILNGLKKAHLYNFEKPSERAPDVILTSLDACKTVVNDVDGFRSLWRPDSFMPGPPDDWISKKSGMLALKLPETEGLSTATTAFYKEAVTNLVNSEHYELAGSSQVDMVDDVFNVAHAQFVSNLFHLPVDGIGSLLSTVHTCCNTAQGPARKFALTAERQKAVQQLAESVQTQFKKFKPGHPQPNDKLQNYMTNAAQACVQSGLPYEQIVWDEIIPLAATVYVNQSRVFAESLDYLLGQGQGLLRQIQEMADLANTASEDKLKQFLHQMRSNISPLTYTREALSSVTVDDGGRQVEISPGQHVICVMEQKDDLPIYSGGDIALCRLLSDSACCAILQVLGQLKGLSRAVGPTGTLRRVTQGHMITYLNEEESTTSSRPVSMKVKWQE